MRIIAGKFKGRKLSEFGGKDIRPTSDRAREGLFSVLQFEIEGKTFLDAFCGSGAVGLEALSRGAKKAILLDQAKASCALAQKNSDTLGAGVRPINVNALDFLNSTSEKFDIIFLDPPYKSNAADEALKIISKRELLNENGLCIKESESADNRPIDGFFIEKTKKYGICVFTFYRKCADNVCVFAGSFDPVTKGHIETVKKAKQRFEKVIVALGVNENKTYAFSKKARLEMLNAAFENANGVEVVDFDGLLVDFMRSRRVRYNVRGIRNETDEKYEREMFEYNKKLYPELINVYINAENNYKNISSTAAKIALKNADNSAESGAASAFLTKEVEEIAKKYIK